MARKPVDTNLRPVLLQPAASPVDTFVQPAPSPLRDLADALGKIDRPLREFMDARAAKQAEEDRIRGEAAFYNDNSEGIAEAVRTGKVPAQYSPSFVKGFKNAQGNVRGNQLAAEFQQAWDGWDGKNNEDPEAYDQFLEDFLRSKLGTDDPEVLRGLMPHVRQIVDRGNTLYTTYRHEQTYNGSRDAHVAGALQDVNELEQEGLSTEEGTNYPVVFQKIGEKREAFVANGGKPEDFDKAMTDAMSVKILSSRDPGLLAWFDQKVPGKDYTYGESPYGQQVKQQMLDSLEVINRRNVSEDAQRAKAEQEAAKDEAHRKAVELLSTNPSAPLPPELLEAGQKADPTFKVRVTEWRDAFSRGYTDPKELLEVYREISLGRGQAAVLDALDRGVFGRAEDLASAANFAKGFEDNEHRITQVLTNPVAERFLKDIGIQTTEMSEWGAPITGMSPDGYEATYDFRRMVQEWVIANPNASMMETEEAVTKIGKAVLDRMLPPEDGGEETAGGRTYERAEDMPFGNPYTDGGEPPSEGGARPAPEERRTEVSPQEQEEDEDIQGGITDQQRAAVQDRSKAMGMTPDEFLQEFGGEQPRDQRTGASPISYQPQQEAAAITPEVASGWIDTAMAEAPAQGLPPSRAKAPDARAGRLLDLIGNHEAAGNYNAVYGNARSKRDLGKLTLDQILATQAAARKRGVASTAVGRYQFIYKTLRGLKKDLGLTGKERFTKDLQDRLGYALLLRRGYRQFLAGKLTKRQFALRLSQEWASLPNPYTGRSYYAGDGLNASSAKVRSVYAALGFQA